MHFYYAGLLVYPMPPHMHFYPHDAMLVRVIAITTCPSVCLSVRHEPVLCQNVKISSLPGSPKTPVFWRQISSPNSTGSPPEWRPQTRVGGKIQQFSIFKRQYLENSSRYG